MTVVDRIFQLIKDNGLTAKEFANIVGISQGNLTDWKTGRAKPSVASLEKIHLNFNVSMEWLLGQSDEKKYVKYKFLEIPESFLSSYCEGLPDYLIDIIKRITFELLLDDIPSKIIFSEIDFEISTYKIPAKNIKQVKNAIIFLYDYNKKYDISEKMEQKKFYMCPIYSSISTEPPHWKEENIIGCIPLDYTMYNIDNAEDCFYLKMKDNSLNKIIAKDTYILLKKQNNAKIEDIVLVSIDNAEPVIRKCMQFEKDIAIFQSLSIEGSSMDIIMNKQRNYKILGKMIGQININN